MGTWVWVTIIAAVSQSLRTAQQKNLTGSLGEFGASFVRFSYAVPFAWTWLLSYSYFTNVSLPKINSEFLFWVIVGGLLQIIFTVLLIKLFSLRSFAAGTAFSKTEVLQASFFEALIIGTIVSIQVGLGIVIGVMAIILLSIIKSKVTIRNLLASLKTKQAILGLASGAFLAICSVAYRVATDSLEGSDLIARAGTTLSISVTFQTVLMGLWMQRYAVSELRKTFIEWRSALLVGFFGALTSFCWFYAFSANAVAPVRAVGQIELVIALLISFSFFKEKPSFKELIAIMLLLFSILLVLFD